MTGEEAARLALEYAPVFAQKVRKEWALADQIAPVAFVEGGDLTRVADNPERLYGLPDEHRIHATVYYSVCETSTHYFLLYAVYHVVDWWKRNKPKDLYNLIRDALDEHVHDMEGALLVVTKEPRRLVDGVFTVAHNNFYLYARPMRPSAVGRARPASIYNVQLGKFGKEDMDGRIWLDRATDRVKLYIESQGHGMYGDHAHWGGGDYTVYYTPAGEERLGGTLQPGETQEMRRYELESLFAPGGLWMHRYHRKVFRQHESGAKWAFVLREKDSLRAGKANPPWSWNDHNDPSPAGEIAADPARFIVRYAEGWGPVSTDYLYNPYLAIEG